MPSPAKDLLFTVAAGLWVTLGVLNLWDHPGVLGAWLGLGCLALLRAWKTPTDHASFAVAGVLGVIGECLCTQTSFGFWTYAPAACSFGWTIPFWLPLVWGFLMLLFHHVGALALRLAPVRIPGLHVLGGAGIPILLLCFSHPAFHIFPPILACYGIVVGVVLVRWNTPEDLAAFYAGGLLGTLGEYLCIHEGIWSYRLTFWSLPWPPWDPGSLDTVAMAYTLPMAWGLSTVMVRNAGSRVAFWMGSRGTRVALRAG